MRHFPSFLSRVALRLALLTTSAALATGTPAPQDTWVDPVGGADFGASFMSYHDSIALPWFVRCDVRRCSIGIFYTHIPGATHTFLRLLDPVVVKNGTGLRLESVDVRS